LLNHFFFEYLNKE